MGDWREWPKDDVGKGNESARRGCEEERVKSGKRGRGLYKGFEGRRLTEKFELARARCRWIAAMSLDQTNLLPAGFRNQL